MSLTLPIFDDVPKPKYVDRVPGRKPMYCKCCRELRWYLNPRTKQKEGEPRIWQAACCGQSRYEREENYASVQK